LYGNDDAAFLFEPLPDACQALPIGNGSSDLGPKSANLAGFLSQAFSRAFVRGGAGFRRSIVARPLSTLRSLLSSRQFTTYFDIFPQNSAFARGFDKIRRFSTVDSAVDRPRDQFRGPKHR
jgi:hypothetical protein